MNYLYHWVPPNMRGDTLFPLHELKELHPDAYHRAIQKYKDRQWLLDAIIPGLGVRWNDVLHLTAVHPIKASRAQRKGGVPLTRQTHTFKIDPRTLDRSKTVIFLDKWKGEKMNPAAVLPFSVGALPQYNSIPNSTIHFYQRRMAVGVRPKVYVGVPHILYHGCINIKNAPIITL